MIETRQLTFTYAKADTPAVRDLEFTVGPGEIIGGLSLLVVGRRRCDILAASDVRLLTMERATYVRIKGDAPALALAIQEAVLSAFARAIGAAGIPEMLSDPATVDGSADDD